MTDAVTALRIRPTGLYSFDLATPTTLDNPTFDHLVLGKQIVTNNVAGYLGCVATSSAFAAGDLVLPFAVEAGSLDGCEVEVLERAAGIAGCHFLDQLAKDADDLRFKRTQRLELLRCIAVQMVRQPGLTRIGTVLEAAIVARGDASLKRTEVDP